MAVASDDHDVRVIGPTRRASGHQYAGARADTPTEEET
jgi:Ni,Fe-hydrogenase III large subunit